jgi:hypothetical protein
VLTRDDALPRQTAVERGEPAGAGRDPLPVRKKGSRAKKAVRPARAESKKKKATPGSASRARRKKAPGR